MSTEEACRQIDEMLKNKKWDTDLISRALPLLPDIALKGLINDAAGLDDGIAKVAWLAEASTKCRQPPQQKESTAAQPFAAKDSSKELRRLNSMRTYMPPISKFPSSQQPTQQPTQQGIAKTQKKTYGWPQKVQYE